jgi:hypothetical protein
VCSPRTSFFSQIGCGEGVDLFAQRTKRLGQKNRFYGKAKKTRELKDQLQRWDVVSPFKEADGLGVDADFAGECLPGKRSLNTQDGNAIINHLHIIRHQNIAYTQCFGSLPRSEGWVVHYRTALPQTDTSIDSTIMFRLVWSHLSPWDLAGNVLIAGYDPDERYDENGAPACRA